LVPLQRCPVAHDAQTPPPVPHAEDSSVVTHVVPLQQPLGHDVGSHTHALPLQRCPVAHAMQTPPPVPHAADVSAVTQLVPPLQQPFGHDVASHAHPPCVLHSCPVVHPTHAPPPRPQVALDELTHVPFEQQPLQLVPPHVHAPPLQACPAVHLPHVLPPDPQAIADWAAWATQLLLLSQQPPGHALAVHVHVPLAPQA
jgi:hypothetical protein